MKWYEYVIYSFLAIVIISSMFVSVVDKEAYYQIYTMEDGFFEDMTFVFLFASGVLMVFRYLQKRKEVKFPANLFPLVIAAGFIFIAGEEISWGQRIFGLETPEFFEEFNSQDEIGLHNFEIMGVNMNKLIFGKIITVVIIVFLFLVPYLYDRKEKLKNLIDLLQIPLPKLHHTVAFLGVFILVSVHPASRAWELYELGLSMVFLAILINPKNPVVLVKRG